LSRLEMTSVFYFQRVTAISIRFRVSIRILKTALISQRVFASVLIADICNFPGEASTNGRRAPCNFLRNHAGNRAEPENRMADIEIGIVYIPERGTVRKCASGRQRFTPQDLANRLQVHRRAAVRTGVCIAVRKRKKIAWPSILSAAKFYRGAAFTSDLIKMGRRCCFRPVQQHLRRIGQIRTGPETCRAP
jgi:hypothetical protein